VNCELTNSVLHGYFDGELDAARAADFERHLLSCPQCVAALEVQEASRSSFQRAGLYERAPDSLRRNLERELRAPSPVADISAGVKSPPSPLWFRLAAIAALLLFGFIGWRLFSITSADRSEAEVASAIVDAHLRSLQPGHLEDVISTDQHTVKPWFDGQVDFAPPVRDFANDGFPLQGGRLDVIKGRSVAVLVYARRKHIINVFIWPSTYVDDRLRSGSQLGYNWLGWGKGGMQLFAVSDVSPSDLNTLHELWTN
jgi:anti-sigma factor RsiW